MRLIQYDKAKSVINMHSAPRFGHSADISLLASSNEGDQSDYVKGVKAFCLFNLILLVIWMVVLIVLKLLGPQKVGCAAGGRMLDWVDLKKEHGSSKRKAIERRYWRIQTVFLIASSLLFVAAALFLSKGLSAVSGSIDELYEINDTIERVTTRAYDITSSLLKEQTQINSTELYPLIHLGEYCRRNAVNDTAQFSNLTLVVETIQESLQEVNTFMYEYVHQTQLSLSTMSQASREVDDRIAWYEGNEWKARLCMVVLIVVNIFLMVGLLLSRSNIVWYGYRRVLKYFLMPIFCVWLVLAVVATYGFGGAAVMNADFCSGGEYPGSVEGTIESIMMQNGVQKEDLIYKSFEYYTAGCSSENPLAIVAEYEPRIHSTIESANLLLQTIEARGVNAMSDLCGADFAPIVSTTVMLRASLLSIQNDFSSAMRLSSCYSISPILRRVFHGPTCSDTVSGLTWMFSCCLAISILGLTMVSVRAALYNAILRPKRKKRTRRQTEREWNEYKEYMAKFYPHDVDKWRFHPSPEKKDLETPRSYDTAITAKPSNDTDSPRDSDDYSFSDGESDVGVFCSPEKQPGAIEMDIVSDLLDTIDVSDDEEELQPLSPSVVKISTPLAPKKKLAIFPRTSLGMKPDKNKSNKSL